jgi:hypothetical protein
VVCLIGTGADQATAGHGQEPVSEHSLRHGAPLQGDCRQPAHAQAPHQPTPNPALRDQGELLQPQQGIVDVICINIDDRALVIHRLVMPF